MLCCTPARRPAERAPSHAEAGVYGIFRAVGFANYLPPFAMWAGLLLRGRCGGPFMLQLGRVRVFALWHRSGAQKRIVPVSVCPSK